MSQPITGSWQQTIIDPPIEAMARVFLERIEQPYDIGTLLTSPDDPDQDPTQVAVAGFIRLEGLGTTQINELEFDCDWGLHAYQDDEVASSFWCRKLTGFAANAQGTKLTVPSYELPDGTVVPQLDWYVGWSRAPIRAQRQIDPTVNLPRYRSMISWRVPGHVLAGP